MVNGMEVLTAVIGFIRRYCVISDAQALTLAIWTLHTWFYDRLSRTTAYVEITGVSGSGKTNIMETLALLSRGSLSVNTIRTMALCRYITDLEGRATIFVDEAERLASGSFGDQRSMLASGYRKGGVHLVTRQGTAEEGGDGKRTEQIPVWCPKAFTSLKTTTTVIHNRCIPIWVERAKPTASLSLEWERAEATSAEIIERFKALVRTMPRMITMEADWLTSERDQEIWTPLVSMAATLRVDDATMRALKAASVDLSSLRGVVRDCSQRDIDEGAKERSYAVRLAKDVALVLRDGETTVFSRELVDRLRGLEVAPWRTYQQTGLDELRLAQLLGAFGLESGTVQVGKGRKGRATAKGYKVSALKAAIKTVQG